MGGEWVADGHSEDLNTVADPTVCPYSLQTHSRGKKHVDSCELRKEIRRGRKLKGDEANENEKEEDKDTETEKDHMRRETTEKSAGKTGRKDRIKRKKRKRIRSREILR